MAKKAHTVIAASTVSAGTTPAATTTTGTTPPPTPPPATPTPPPAGGSPFASSEDIKNGLLILVIGVVVALASFFLANWGLGYFESLNYLLKAMFAFGIAVLFVWTLNKVMGNKPSRFEAPILATLIVAFLFTVLSGYETNGSPFKSLYQSLPKEQNGFSETGTVKNVGDIWFTDKVFGPGVNVQIEVLYNKVLMVSGDTLAPGKYDEHTIGNGKLMFEGVIDAPAKVKITVK